MTPPPDGERTGVLSRLVGVYDRIVDLVAGVAMAAVTVIMLAQVYYRYVLNGSLIWAEEACRYILVIITFLLVGKAFQRGDMIGVGFLTRMLSDRARIVLAVPVRLAMVAFLGLTAWFGWRFANFNGTFAIPAVDFVLTSLTGREVRGAVSMYWLYLLIPIGCLLLAAHIVASIVTSLRSLRAAAPAPTRSD